MCCQTRLLYSSLDATLFKVNSICGLCRCQWFFFGVRLRVIPLPLRRGLIAVIVPLSPPLTWYRYTRLTNPLFNLLCCVSVRPPNFRHFFLLQSGFGPRLSSHWTDALMMLEQFKRSSVCSLHRVWRLILKMLTVCVMSEKRNWMCYREANDQLVSWLNSIHQLVHRKP